MSRRVASCGTAVSTAPPGRWRDAPLRYASGTSSGRFAPPNSGGTCGSPGQLCALCPLCALYSGCSVGQMQSLTESRHNNAQSRSWLGGGETRPRRPTAGCARSVLTSLLPQATTYGGSTSAGGDPGGISTYPKTAGRAPMPGNTCTCAGAQRRPSRPRVASSSLATNGGGLAARTGCKCPAACPCWGRVLREEPPQLSFRIGDKWPGQATGGGDVEGGHAP
jgi:hypothetical protein